MNQQKNKVNQVDEDFSNIVVSFSQTALVGMGKISNPQTGKVDKNLNMARTYIDMLEMLSEKTKGNLTKKEKDILESTVTNLQLTYVDEMEKEKESPNTEDGKDKDSDEKN